jgi:hypothetical protein
VPIRRDVISLKCESMVSYVLPAVNAILPPEQAQSSERRLSDVQFESMPDPLMPNSDSTMERYALAVTDCRTASLEYRAWLHTVPMTRCRRAVGRHLHHLHVHLLTTMVQGPTGDR